MIGNPGDRLTRGNRLVSLLLRQNSNNGTPAGGMAHAIQQGLAGLIAGQDSRRMERAQADEAAAYRAMAAGMSAQPWRNPDTGQIMTSSAPVGGYEGAIHALQGLNTPISGKLATNLLMQKMERDRQRADVLDERAYRDSRYEIERGHSKEDRAEERLADRGEWKFRFGAENDASEARLRLEDDLSRKRAADAPETFGAPFQAIDRETGQRVFVRLGNRGTVQPVEGFGAPSPTPVPGRDVPYPQDVQAQRVETAEAQAVAQQGAKPMPTAALRMQQDALDAIATASSINADLGAIREKIQKGELELGPISNARNQVANALGLSSEQSRNFATFRATLEKLRNDTLRLNKGVQTEGDAVRAWNELLANITDSELVLDRLREIDMINKRASTIQNLNVQNLRSNYGLPALDIESYLNMPSALGDGGGWSIRRVD